MSTLLTASQTFVAQALDLHVEFAGLVREAKEKAFDVGLNFMKAQQNLAKGETFEALITPFIESGHISRRSVFSYVRFTKNMMEWARLEDPRLKREDAVVAAGRQLVMQSASDFLELMRESAGVLKPAEGGGRRAEKPIEAAGPQFSFKFFDDLLWALEQKQFVPLVDLARENRSKLEESVSRAERFVREARAALSTATVVEAPAPVAEAAPAPDSLPAWYAYQNRWNPGLFVKPYNHDEAVEALNSPSIVWVLKHIEARTQEEALALAAEEQAKGHGLITHAGKQLKDAGEWEGL